MFFMHLKYFQPFIEEIFFTHEPGLLINPNASAGTCRNLRMSDTAAAMFARNFTIDCDAARQHDPHSAAPVDVPAVENPDLLPERQLPDISAAGWPQELKKKVMISVIHVYARFR